MWVLGHHATPNDRHLHVSYLSRAGVRLEGGKPVEVDPSPAWLAANLVMDHLVDRGFVRVGHSALVLSDVQHAEGRLAGGGIVLPETISRFETFVVCYHTQDGHVPAALLDSLDFPQAGNDFSGRLVLPVRTLADSTGTPGDAGLADLRRTCRGADVETPLDVRGERPVELAREIFAWLDERVW